MKRFAEPPPAGPGARRLAVLALAAALTLFAAEDDGGAESGLPQTRAVETEPEGSAPEVDRDAAAPSPRGRYNQGLDQLAAGDPEAAAEAFLAARDAAGPDPELRYRAAFNLGVALAAGVDAEVPPADAIETLRRSAAWFNDAVRLAPPADEDARINLELVSRRIIELADQLNEGNRLEGRLDRLIDDQRGLRDQVRRLLSEVRIQAAEAEPLGFQSEFHGLASRERMLMAEVGDCIDLAAEERLFLEQSPDEQRTPEQQARIFQLAGTTTYLERARQSLLDARRLLRRLEGERGHRRADAALAELKRAREQLQDPVTVLKAVARDEQELIGHTGALAAFDQGAIRLGQSQPAWLTAKHLAERQTDIGARSGGVLDRFEAVLAAGAPSGERGAAEGRLRRAVTGAAPVLGEGLAAMRDAIAALEAGDATAAHPAQNRALAALHRTIEEFAGVKDLIELAHAGALGIVALLTPNEDAAAEPRSASERAEAVSGLVDSNRRRLERLQVLLAEEAAALDVEAVDGQSEQDEQARETSRQRYRVAETLRAQAEEGLEKLSGEVARIADSDGDPAAARAAGAETVGALEELRRLFFSVVEHLRDLHAQQSRTHDQTATLQFESSADGSDALVAALGLAAHRQQRHGALGDALASALAQQADAAAAANGADGAEAGQEALAAAAREVRKASGRMHGAGIVLGDAVERAAAMSPELEPALADQLAAIEHLEEALRALLPPDRDQQPPDGGGERQQSEQEQDAPAEEEQQLSQRQALKRLQAIRDREAQRQRNRLQDPMASAPVEKDW